MPARAGRNSKRRYDLNQIPPMINPAALIIPRVIAVYGAVTVLIVVTLPRIAINKNPIIVVNVKLMGLRMIRVKARPKP